MSETEPARLQVVAEPRTPDLDDPAVRAQRRRDAEQLIRNEASRRRERRQRARIA